jgi:hypothetical protein
LSCEKNCRDKGYEDEKGTEGDERGRWVERSEKRFREKEERNWEEAGK